MLRVMRNRIASLLALGITLSAQQKTIVPPLEETGFQQIFDGQSLKGWDCDPEFWRAEGGQMIGETRPDHQPKYNVFCIWSGGAPADFELKLQYRLTGETGNSGIQYRSIELPEVGKWVLKGYQ